METEVSSKISFQSLFSHASIGQMNVFSQAVFADLRACHTAAKGYQFQVCDNTNCLENRVMYHCCGNRHCPHCGSEKRAAWVEDRLRELLPTPYYHVVFTLPHELNGLVMGNRKILFDALFKCATQTLLKHGTNEEFLGAELGITSVLHTWGQDLSFHPHVHCIVTGGGWTGEKWMEAKRKNNRFLFPPKSLGKMYKSMFMSELEKDKSLVWGEIDKESLLKSIRFKRWVVYAKAPFGGPSQVVAYLGRYTHKVAITQQRILEVTENRIRFKYRDYADGDKEKEMWLSHEEFLRRFETHILPKGYVKIRHSGFLRHRNKGERLAAIRSNMGLSETPLKVKIPIAIRLLERYGTDIGQCPCCKIGQMVVQKDTRIEGRKEFARPFPLMPAPS